MTTEPLDPAAIMAAHAPQDDHGEWFCDKCELRHPCEPYRLAVEVAKLQASYVRVERSHAHRTEQRDAARAEVATLRAREQRVRGLHRYVVDAWSPNESSVVYAVDAEELDAALDDPTETCDRCWGLGPTVQDACNHALQKDDPTEPERKLREGRAQRDAELLAAELGITIPAEPEQTVQCADLHQLSDEPEQVQR